MMEVGVDLKSRLVFPNIFTLCMYTYFLINFKIMKKKILFADIIYLSHKTLQILNLVKWMDVRTVIKNITHFSSTSTKIGML